MNQAPNTVNGDAGSYTAEPRLASDDVREFFLGWANAARNSDPTWFQENLHDHFHNVVAPAGLVLDKNRLIEYVAQPRELQMRIVDLSVTQCGLLATATVLAHVMERALGPETGLAPPSASGFLNELSHGVTVLYQTAWVHDHNAWMCIQQAVIGSPAGTQLFAV